MYLSYSILYMCILIDTVSHPKELINEMSMSLNEINKSLILILENLFSATDIKERF